MNVQRGFVILMAVVLGWCGAVSVASAEEPIKGRGVVAVMDLKSKPPTVTLGAQGWELVLQVDPNKTSILKSNQPVKLSDIQPGDDVYTTYEIKGKKNVARTVWVQPVQKPGQAAQKQP